MTLEENMQAFWWSNWIPRFSFYRKTENNDGGQDGSWALWHQKETKKKKNLRQSAWSSVVLLFLCRYGNQRLLHGGDEEREARGGGGRADVHQHRVGRLRRRRLPGRHPDGVWRGGGQDVHQPWRPHVRMMIIWKMCLQLKRWVDTLKIGC